MKERLFTHYQTIIQELNHHLHSLGVNIEIYIELCTVICKLILFLKICKPVLS